jgi:hypothetical protein
MEAFNAFKKYLELDKKDVLMKLEQNASLFDIYNNYFDMAAKAFNAKNYASAVTNFKNALMVESYVRSEDLDYNGYKFPSLDTTLILNTAVAARLAKNDSESIACYQVLADSNVTGPKYLEIYETLVEYYKNKKNNAAFNKALDQGRKLYPTQAYWNAIEVEQISEMGNKQDVFKKYDELTTQNPTEYVWAYNYSVELFNYVYNNEDKSVDKTPYKTKLEEMIKKTIAIKSTGDANLLMAKYLYNNYFDLEDEAKAVKGATPQDVNKRKALYAKAISQKDLAIPYCEAANKYYESFPTLTREDKSGYRKSLNILQDIYQAKKDFAKVAFYEKKANAIQ